MSSEDLEWLLDYWEGVQSLRADADLAGLGPEEFALTFSATAISGGDHGA